MDGFKMNLNTGNTTNDGSKANSSFRDRNRRRYISRLAIPSVLGVGVVAVAGFYPGVVSASVPNLSPISASALITKALSAKAPIYSGSIIETGNSGIPSQAISALGGKASSNPLTTLLTQALTSSVSANYWVNGTGSLRVQIPNATGESDLYSTNGVTWLYNSTNNSATKIVSGQSQPTSPTSALAKSNVVTPAAIASKILASLPAGSTTSVDSSSYVAGQATYTLTVHSNDPNSLIKDVRFSIDATTGDTLGVYIDSSSSSTVFSLAYQSLSYQKPASSVFSYSPAPGTTLKTTVLGGTSMTHPPMISSTAPGTKAPSLTHRVIGSGFSEVVVLSGPAGSASSTGTSTSKALAMLKAIGVPKTTSLGSGYLITLNFGSAFISQNGTVAFGAVPGSVLLNDLG
ncbi:hypothetical protein AXFE_01100 [Acidithrix ferrooxidans]|uniref:Outer-membrane lipoprotein carrier protein n=2 Tax=Acidimicrobiaceae TaxID=84994 RepID=A0A0D8HMC0_9ACTN|nr:hypothetical protein AXFE_01100 [Acidithrix ferrooxidans]CAG4901633.1 unnamed protein product [Acidithrix sp. C25]